MLDFMNAANAWLFVSMGAMLIGFKETFELSERIDAPIWSFWVACAAMPLLCLGLLVERMRRTQSINEWHAGLGDESSR